MIKANHRLKSKIERKNTVTLSKHNTKNSDRNRTVSIRKALMLLLFAALGFLIYSNTFNSPFVFDDAPNIEENPPIRLTKLTLKQISAAGFKSANPQRPVANISFALNYYFHRYNVIGYHCTNIVIHILTGIFLYLFLKNTFAIPSLHSKYGRHKWIPFFAALIWLVHPIQTQSVTYIVQRMTSLSAMFYILSLLLYAKGRLASNRPQRSWPWFLGCMVTGMLAIGCKQVAATLPFFILLYEWYFFQDLNGSWLKRRMLYVIGVLIIFSIVALYFLGANPLEKILSAYKNREFTTGQRLLTQPRVVMHYISLLTCPHPSRLNLDHHFIPSRSLVSPATTLLSLAALVGMIVLAFYTARRQRLFSFCILWFLGNLVIESSIIALELAFEHRLYLPSMLVALAVVVLPWRYMKQKWGVAAFCVVAALFCFWTYQRNKVWSDPVTLWKDCVAKSPDKPRPHSNLASALYEQRRYEDAISHYKRALKIKPDHRNTNGNMGLALLELAEYDKAAEQFRIALNRKGDLHKWHLGLGLVLKKKGRLDQAVQHFKESLRIKPDYARSRKQLADGLFSQNKFEQAIVEYQQVLRILPRDVSTHNDIGVAFVRLGRLDDALPYFTKALQLKPDSPDAHNNLGYLLVRQGKVDGAIRHFTEAMRLKPDWVGPINNLAWLLATYKQAEFRNPREAIRLAEQACHLTEYKNPSLMDTLAAAYAAAGRFTDATATAEKALKLAGPSAKKKLIEQIRNRLRLYKAARPYIEHSANYTQK